MLVGTYELGETYDRKRFVVPLSFDGQTLGLTTFPSRRAHAPVTTLVNLIQGPGFRVPGQFKMAGYVFVTDGANEFSFAPVMSENPAVAMAFQLKLAGQVGRYFSGLKQLSGDGLNGPNKLPDSRSIQFDGRRAIGVDEYPLSAPNL
jgi:hypothetical protein